jgi:hypothetical protein
VGGAVALADGGVVVPRDGVVVERDGNAAAGGLDDPAVRGGATLADGAAAGALAGDRDVVTGAVAAVPRAAGIGAVWRGVAAAVCVAGRGCGGADGASNARTIATPPKPSSTAMMP